MTIAKGNTLAFKTFDYLKVNETEIVLPKFSKSDFSVPSDEKEVRLIPELETVTYGVSQESLEWNQEFLNLYKVYEIFEKESVDYPVLRLQTNDKENLLCDRHDVMAHPGAKAKIVLDYTSVGNSEKLRNTVIRIVAKENAQVELFIIQREDEKSISLESIVIVAEDNAKVKVSQFQLGSHTLYTNFQCELLGDGSEGYVDSIYFGKGNDEFNMLYNMIHRGQRTISGITVNGALKGKAHKNFKSNLEFKEGACEAKGSEEEYAILLEDTVHSISVPLMLCHEDDVEGNHAASAGKLDPNILFYIMTRGFSLEEAESLIIESKFAGSIDKLQDKELEQEVWQSVQAMIKAGK